MPSNRIMMWAISAMVMGSLLLTPLCASAQVPSPPATASGPTSDNGETVTLNFNNADIDTVIRAIGKITGRNFIVDPRVKGTLNIVTSRPVHRSTVYPILLSALRLQGFAVVEGDSVVKVVPEADAKTQAIPSGRNAAPASGGDRLVTEVFQIKHESASQLVQIVRPLVTASNPVSAYPSNNTLVITDYAENINRIRKLIDSIDVPQGESQIIKLLNASAVDVAGMINKLYNEATNGDVTQRVSVIADPRSNALILRSENRARLQSVRSMIAQLDESASIGNLRVVYLKNGDATKIAQTLRALASGDTTQAAGTAKAATGTAGTTSTTSSGTTGSFGSNVGGAYIYADTSTNSLVINAPDGLYNSLRGIIEQLDRRPAQVYVEALIAEVSAERASEFGIQWNSAYGGKTAVFGGTSFSSGGKNILSVASGTTPSNGLNLAVGGGTVEIPGIGTVANIAMLARYLESDSKTNILSTPSLITVDNEEAKIVVGQNVPFVTGTFTNSTSGTSNPFQTIERKDVGLTLKIKPQITEGGTIRLNISQEASTVTAVSATTGPTTNKRSLDSTVIVDDGAFLALGGLVEDSYSGSVEKVPLLGDIPLLGALFRYDTRTHKKTNLVIFLRPVIIRSAEDANAITSSRYDYVIGSQKASKTDTLVPDKPVEPQLPPILENGVQKPVKPAPTTAPAVTPAAPAPAAP